jgi:hypothetical protein
MAAFERNVNGWFGRRDVDDDVEAMVKASAATLDIALEGDELAAVAEQFRRMADLAALLAVDEAEAVEPAPVFRP